MVKKYFVGHNIKQRGTKMYVYQGAFLRQKSVNTIWRDVDISQMKMMDIFNTYASGYIELTNNFLDGTLYVDLQQLKATNLPFQNVTFNTWLGTLGNKLIPGTDVKPVYDNKEVRYTDAWRAGYDIQRAHPRTNDTVGYMPSDLPELFVTRAGIDPGLLQNRALFTVNGYLHLSYPAGLGVRLKNGGNTIDKMGRNQVGLISFERIGDIAQYPITAAMVSKGLNETPMYKEVFVCLNKDLRNKSILVSLGGFLNLSSDSFTIINPEIGLIKLSLKNIGLHKKILASLNDIDLSVLGLHTSPGQINSLAMEDLLDDGIITRYLTQANTFIIVVNTPVLYFERLMVDNIKLFNIYESQSIPLYPMIDSLGRLPEYHLEKQDKTYILKTNPLYSLRYNFETAPLSTQARINQVVELDGYEKEIGHLLKISTRNVTA